MRTSPARWLSRYKIRAIGQETGTGGRVTRINGVWQTPETFPIDGLTDPDAFLLLEGEGRFDAPPTWSGTYAGVDHYALKNIGSPSPLTFRYRKRQGGDHVGDAVWFQQDIDFTTLPMPITGPNTGTFKAYGLTRLMYPMMSVVAGTVWTSSNVSPYASDLWFIR